MKDAGITNKPTKDRVSNTGHRSEHGGRSDCHMRDTKRLRDTRLRGHGVLDRIVPAFTHMGHESRVTGREID